MDKPAEQAAPPAADEGKPESDCPIIRSELVVEWIRGHRAWVEENHKDAA